MASPNENDLNVTAACRTNRTWWMFCRAACDISCDEHQPHLPLVVPKDIQPRKTAWIGPGSRGPERFPATLTMCRHHLSLCKSTIWPMFWKSVKTFLFLFLTFLESANLFEFIGLNFLCIFHVWYSISQNKPTDVNCCENMAGRETFRDLLYLNHNWVCVYLVWVCLRLTETDRHTEQGGWMRWKGGASINTVSVEHKDSLTLLWTFRGVAEATREGRGQHSCSSPTMHCFANSTERRQSPQAAHMSLNVIRKNRLLCYIFVLFF